MVAEGERAPVDPAGELEASAGLASYGLGLGIALVFVGLCCCACAIALRGVRLTSVAYAPGPIQMTELQPYTVPSSHASARAAEMMSSPLVQPISAVVVSEP